MKKNSIILYKFLLKEEDLSIKQKIVLSQILYMIYKDKHEEIVLTKELKEKIKDTLKYHKDTVNITLKKALDLGILDNLNEKTYYVYDKKYSINKKTTYINIPFDIFYNKDLSETDKIILSYCNSYTKNNNNCKVNNKQIAKDLNLSLQVVERSMSKLKTNGFIESRYEKSGFVIRKREIFIDTDKIHNLFIKSVEKLEAENVENQTIKEVNELSIDTVENQTIEINKIDKLDNMNNIKHVTTIDTVKNMDNTFILSNSLELLEKLKSVKLTTEDAKKLYFDKKKEFELAKEIYDNTLIL